MAFIVRNVRAANMLICMALAMFILWSVDGGCQEKGGRPTLADLVRQYKPAVVVIRTYGESGALIGGGTGFFIAGDRVVSNHHVLEGANKATITTSDGLVYDILGILVDEPLWDLTIVQTQAPRPPVIPLNVVATLPELGTELWVLGNPRGLLLKNSTLSVTRGIVSNVVTLPALGSMTAIQFDAAISSGNSGGPVFDEEGKVIGVVRASVNDAQNLNFAIPGHYVNELAVGTMRPLGYRRMTPPGHDKLVVEGQSLLWLADYAKAIPMFEKVVHEDSTNAMAWFFLGYCHSQLNKFDLAAREYRASYALKRSGVTLNNLAVTFSSMGKPDSAEFYYKRAAELEPSALVLTNVGIALSAKGQLDSAQTYLKAALELDPGDTATLMCLGNVYIKAEQYSDALATFRKVQHLVKNSREAYEGLGRAFYKQSLFDSAVQNYSKALRVGSDDSGAYRNWNMMGCAYMEMGDYASALGALRTAVKKRPDFAEGHADLGRALYRSHSFAESVRELEIGCGVKEKNADACAEVNVAYYNWCVDLAKRSAYDSILLITQQAIQARHESTDMYYWKARALVTKGAFDDGIAAFKQAVQLDAQNKQALLGIGYAFKQQNKFGDAINEGFQRAIGIDAEFADAYAGLGSCYFGLHDNSHAVEAYEHALRLDPDDVASRFNIALAYVALGNTDQACEHLVLLRTQNAAMAAKLATQVNCN